MRIAGEEINEDSLFSLDPEKQEKIEKLEKLERNKYESWLNKYDSFKVKTEDDKFLIFSRSAKKEGKYQLTIFLDEKTPISDIIKDSKEEILERLCEYHNLELIEAKNINRGNVKMNSEEEYLYHENRGNESEGIKKALEIESENNSNNINQDFKIDITNDQVIVHNRNYNVEVREYKDVLEDTLKQNNIEPTNENIKKYMKEIAEDMGFENIEHSFERSRDNINLEKVFDVEKEIEIEEYFHVKGEAGEYFEASIAGDNLSYDLVNIDTIDDIREGSQDIENLGIHELDPEEIIEQYSTKDTVKKDKPLGDSFLKKDYKAKVNGVKDDLIKAYKSNDDFKEVVNEYNGQEVENIGNFFEDENLVEFNDKLEKIEQTQAKDLKNKKFKLNQKLNIIDRLEDEKTTIKNKISKLKNEFDGINKLSDNEIQKHSADLDGIMVDIKEDIEKGKERIEVINKKLDKLDDKNKIKEKLNKLDIKDKVKSTPVMER